MVGRVASRGRGVSCRASCGGLRAMPGVDGVVCSHDSAGACRGIALAAMASRLGRATRHRRDRRSDLGGSSGQRRCTVDTGTGDQHARARRTKRSLRPQHQLLNRYRPLPLRRQVPAQFDRRKRKPNSQSPPTTRRGSAPIEVQAASSPICRLELPLPRSHRLRHPLLRPLLHPRLRLRLLLLLPLRPSGRRPTARKRSPRIQVLRRWPRHVERSPLIKSLRPMARLGGESSTVSRLNVRRMPVPTGHRQPSLPPMRSAQLQLRQQQSAGSSVPAARSTSQQTGRVSSDCRSRKSSI